MIHMDCAHGRMSLSEWKLFSFGEQPTDCCDLTTTKIYFTIKATNTRRCLRIWIISQLPDGKQKTSVYTDFIKGRFYDDKCMSYTFFLNRDRYVSVI